MPLAVAAERNRVRFRASKELVEECDLKPGLLSSVYYDDKAGQLAIMSDPTNKTGEARKWRACGPRSSSLIIEFPRTDLFERLWPEKKGMEGLELNEKRRPGTILFFVPES